MEQAFRRLIGNLENHELVEKVDPCFHYITVTWKSGIKERLIFNTFDNRQVKAKQRYLKSKIRPQFMPEARWWEDLSNGCEIPRHYLEKVEFEEDIKKYSNLINWKWSDFIKAGFYERLITIHEILQYIINNGWSKEQFPENSLRESLQSLYDENSSNYKFKRKKGLKIRSFAGKERPGEKVIRHFMPYGFYGKNDPSFFMDGSRHQNRRRIYLAIMNIIKNNTIRRKKGKKIFMDFNYRNILKMMRDQSRSIPIKPYVFKQIGLFRTIIEDLELQNKSFYDVDPALGELHLAAHLSGCPYYYRESAPFDEYGPAMAEFLDSDCSPDNNNVHDFGIYSEFNFDYDLTDEAYIIMSEKTDLSIIYVANWCMDQWNKNHPKPHETIDIRSHRDLKRCGKFMLYY